jgi:predicted amidohydrolase
MQLKIALAQIDIAFGMPDENMATVGPLLATAAAQGAALLVLPELWATGYDLTHAAELAAPLAPTTSGLHGWLAAQARAQGIAVAGSLLTQGHPRPTNTATLHSATGDLLASYAKLHLFGLMAEDTHLAAGNAMSLCDAPWGPTALAICYDLRFPELFRAYATQGAKLIIVPAEWPTARREHWHTLLRARAIENQCFVVGVNRVGSDPTTSFGGHSLVIDPWGDVLVAGSERAELLFAELDLGQVAETRARLPVLPNRRPDIY